MPKKLVYKNRIKRGAILKIILSCIATASKVTTPVAVSKAMEMLSIFGIDRKRYDAAGYLNAATGKLHKKGLVTFVDTGENKYIELTDKGELLLEQYNMENIFLDGKKNKWDGKWRIVMFDIKEYSRTARRQLRDTLIRVGFVRVQNSVWVFPYDCEEFIFLLKTNFELGKSVLFAVVEKLENDSWLRKEFDLA